jgi:hypothetical protein
MINLSELVKIKLKRPDDFLKVKETLTRIGVANNKTKTLYQSCHILHKRSEYYIVHFKQLFMLDGRESNFTSEDHGRLNTIVALLSDWELIEVIDPNTIIDPRVPISSIKILAYGDKADWKLEQKYAIGIKK